MGFRKTSWVVVALAVLASRVVLAEERPLPPQVARTEELMRPRDSARLGVSVGQIEELLAVRVGVHGERWQGKAWGIGGRLELGADSEIFGNTSQILGASPFIFVGAKQGVLQVYAGVGPGFELVVPESQVSQLDALAEVHGNLSVHLWHLAFALGATVQFSARGRHGGLVTPSIGGSF